MLMVLGLNAQSGDTTDLSSVLSSMQAGTENSLYQFSNGIWINLAMKRLPFDVTRGHGIVHIKNDGTLETFSASKHNLSNHQIYQLAEFDSTIFAATDYGLLYLNQGKFEVWPESLATGATNFYSLFPKGDSLYFGCQKGAFLWHNHKLEKLSDYLDLPFACSFVKTAGDFLYAGDGSRIYIYNYNTKRNFVKQVSKSGFNNWRAELCGTDLYVFNPEWNTVVMNCKIWHDSDLFDIADVQSRCELQVGYSLPAPRFIMPWKTTFYTLHDLRSSCALVHLSPVANETWNSVGPLQVDINAICKTDGGYLRLVNRMNLQFLLIHSSETEMNQWLKGVSHDGLSHEGLSIRSGNIRYFAGTDNLNRGNQQKNTCIENETCLSTVDSRAIWIGGFDEDSLLHLAASTTGERGTDFQPGPLNRLGYAMKGANERYNQVWYAELSTILNHNAEYNRYGNVAVVDPQISNWLAYRVEDLDTIQLAPWKDENHNGYYDPEFGDYPLINGHWSAFWVMNDDCKHTESNGLPMHIQVCAMAWGFHCPGSLLDSMNVILDNTVFLEYSIRNKSDHHFHHCYLSEWNDADMGGSTDDASGCNPLANVAYTCNGDNYDEGFFGCGINPGAQCVQVLNGPIAMPADGIDNNNNGVVDEAGETCLMTRFCNGELNDAGNRAAKMYQLMSEGDTFCKQRRFSFPGNADPDHPDSTFTEKSLNVPSGERIMLLSSGPFDLQPYETVSLTMASYYVRNKQTEDQLPEILKRSRQISDVYHARQVAGCETLKQPGKPIGKTESFWVYPNPGAGEFAVSVPPVLKILEVYNLQGALLQQVHLNNGTATLNLRNQPDGVYLIRGNDGIRSFQSKLVKMN